MTSRGAYLGILQAYALQKHFSALGEDSIFDIFTKHEKEIQWASEGKSARVRMKIFFMDLTSASVSAFFKLYPLEKNL